MENQTNNTEIRPIAGINGLKFRAVGKINLIQGDQESLSIEADAEIRSRIHTEIVDGILIISYESDWKDWTGINFIDKGVTIFTLAMKEIQSLTLSGVGNLDATSITTDTLSLTLSGPATITIGTLKVNTLDVEMSGVGSIDVAGICGRQNLNLSGAGSYKASRLETDLTTVKLSGVGSATVWAKNNLEAAISGAGSVEYYGSPQITQKISGIGMLKYLGNR